ncbi:ChuX/HutX family heme-like substrate-binding protein [Tundrisphaera lichenicola]|uniref:ChuX/HutX family heme-like substrate-binding protein n=1 Tax=Tundrisphaera lichenicola TaxID=2029860 RepID=UPI003EB971CD
MDASTSTDQIGSIRDYFQDDPSRMTMMAARKFGVPEQAVVDALVGQWPITRLRDEVFRDLMEALPSLGVMRVFVRSRAAVIESVGVFGGYSETGPFYNVQTDTLDMHILHAELGPIYSVRKVGHDSDFVTHSFQFFDKSGDAAFKAYLWEDYPKVPAATVEAFQDLTRRFSQP